MRNTLTYILLFFSLTVYAQSDSVDVVKAELSIADTIPTVIPDTLQTVVADTTITDTVAKRPGIFKRIFRFFDRCFSPPRDRNYIDVQDYYNWCGMAQITTRFEVYQMDADDKFILRVSPRPRTRVGPFFGWRFAFFGYNIDLKSVFMKSDDTDLAASIYSAAFGFDLFYRRVGGNYNIYKLKVDGKDYSQYLKGEPFDGINMAMTRISFSYIFNYKHYSQQAAFSQTHRQIISAGSPIAGIQYAHNRCDIDWKLLSEKMSSISGKPSTDEALSGEQYNDEISLTGGYGYNWVFAKNWLFGVEATGSIGYLIQGVHNEMKYDGEKSRFVNNIEAALRKNIALDATFRFALLWNCGPVFAGTQGVAFYYQHGNGVMMSRDFIAQVYAFVGFNF